MLLGGDSGLGRAAAIMYVKEGAKVVIPYYDEDKDVEYTKQYIEKLGGSCLLIKGDIRDKSFSKDSRITMITMISITTFLYEIGIIIFNYFINGAEIRALYIIKTSIFHNKTYMLCFEHK